MRELSLTHRLQWTKISQQLSAQQQHSIVELAIQRRAEVAKQYKKEEETQSRQRREKLLRDKCRRDAVEQRAKKEKVRLSNLHLITTTQELKQALCEIDSQSFSSKKKCEMKRAIIKEQVNIGKKVLNEAIKLYFTHKGRQRPIDFLVRELSDVIQWVLLNIIPSVHEKIMTIRGIFYYPMYSYYRGYRGTIGPV